MISLLPIARREALDRILAAVRAEVTIGAVTALECADWIDYALLHDDAVRFAADDLVSGEEDAADAAATRTAHEELDGALLADTDDPLDFVDAQYQRQHDLAEELDPLYDEPLAQQEVWL